MTNFKLKVSLLAIALFVLVPQVSLAYFTTDQKAVQLNSDTVLYTITYKFGLPKASLNMPLAAVQGLDFGDASGQLGYTFLNNDERVNVKTAYGIVLSDAKVIDNKYYVPKEELATFTLVVVAKLDAGLSTQSDENADLSLLVTSLPFTMTRSENESARLQLNPSELKYYKTPAISLK